MNEGGCALVGEDREVKFPDIPPVELCRRHSCLDNFILSSCIAKASDNLARLDEILNRQRLKDCVKRSYRRATQGGRIPDSRAERKSTNVTSLQVDSRPHSSRIAEDVHSLLENLGTLVRRLEGDINKTWARTLQLEAVTAREHRDIRRTSSGFQMRLHATVSHLRDSWRSEWRELEDGIEKAQQQGDEMAETLAVLQKRVGDMGEQVQRVRADGVTAGEETRRVFAELRELKQCLRQQADERREEHWRANRAHHVMEAHRSAAEMGVLQRTVRRRRLEEQLQVVMRDVSAATSQQDIVQQTLQQVTAECADAETQVTASLERLAEKLQEVEAELESSESSLDLVPELESSDIMYVTLQDAVTQMEKRLISTRSQGVQMEIACRDKAQQIGKLLAAQESMQNERKELEVEIEGVKIHQSCSAQQIKRNVNIITARCINMRKRIQANITKQVGAQKATASAQPKVFLLEDDVKDAKKAMRIAKQEEAPLVAELNALRAKYGAEEDAIKARINQLRAEYRYQSQARRDLERSLIGGQNRLMLRLEDYELTLSERVTLEQSFEQQYAAALPVLERLRAENARVLSQLVKTSRARSAADRFIDENGAELMTQTAAVTFALQLEETQAFDIEQQMEVLAAKIVQVQEKGREHSEHLRRLAPQAEQLEEDIECLESELLFLEDTCQDRDRELEGLSKLTSDWQQIKIEYRAKHSEYLRQAHRKTDMFQDIYERAVKRNAELREKYQYCVLSWMAARMRTATRVQPLHDSKDHLANVIQVVRLMQSGVANADQTLALRHLYFSGELNRGQFMLGELFERVSHLRGDMALACEHVVREFIGLMKGELPFVILGERETQVREEGVQTDRECGDAERRIRQRRRKERQRRLVMAVAELGDGEPGRPALPPVRKNSEKPATGLGKVHHSPTKLPRL